MRPANMRITHGLRFNLSVSNVECVEDKLINPWMVRETGAGMDAPAELPTGSVKAFFTELSGGRKHCFGFTQRTTPRPE